jgi:hypothetical protein
MELLLISYESLFLISISSSPAVRSLETLSDSMT